MLTMLLVNAKAASEVKYSIRGGQFMNAIPDVHVARSDQTVLLAQEEKSTYKSFLQRIIVAGVHNNSSFSTTLAVKSKASSD